MVSFIFSSCSSSAIKKIRGKSGLQYGNVKGENLSPFLGADQWNRKYIQVFIIIKMTGVKSAKLCVEQGQIGKRLNQAMISFRVDRKDECSPPFVWPG